jgi:hypothetical protein
VPFDGPAFYARAAAESLGVSDPQAIDPATRLLGHLSNLVSQVYDRRPADRAGSLPYLERHLQTLEVALAAGKAMVAEHVAELDTDTPALKAKKLKKAPGPGPAVPPASNPQ